MILAGGTGGHIYPALAVAEVLRAEGVRLRWLGSAGGMETRIVPRAGIEIVEIMVSVSYTHLTLPTICSV